MTQPYAECTGCPVQPFCKAFAGTVNPRHSDWCRAKYRLNKASILSNLPEEYLEANTSTFTIDEHNQKAFEKLKGYLQDIVSLCDLGTNFMFYGSKTGSGKTYAGACILNHYMMKTCVTDRFDFENPLTSFVFYPDLMDELRYGDREELGQRMQVLKNVPVLLLDDMGAGTISEFSREQTLLLINYRNNKKLSTIYTSNFTLKQLEDEKRLGARIVSRMMARTKGFELVGIDRRRSH